MLGKDGGGAAGGNGVAGQELPIKKRRRLFISVSSKWRGREGGDSGQNVMINNKINYQTIFFKPATRLVDIYIAHSVL